MSLQPKRLLDIPKFDAAQTLSAQQLTRKPLIRAFDRAFRDLQTCLANNGYNQLSGFKIIARDPDQLPHLDEVTVASWHRVNRSLKLGNRYDFRSDGNAIIYQGTLTNGLVKPEMESCTCDWEEARRHLLKLLIEQALLAARTLLAARSLLTVFTPELVKDLYRPGAYLWEEKKTRRRRSPVRP